MLTIGQHILRTVFYLMCAYAAYLSIKVLVRSHLNKKVMTNCQMYVVTSVMLLIILGNIIIFEIDQFDAILGTMQEHTIIFSSIIILAGTTIFYLKRMIDEKHHH